MSLTLIKRLKFRILLILLQLLSANSWAQKTIEVSKQHTDFYNTDFNVWEDSTNTATIEQISKPHFDRNFIPTCSDNPMGIKSKTTYWIKFKIKNKIVGKTLLIELTSQFKKANLYIPNTETGTLTIKHSGIKYPYAQREFLYRSNLFELPYSPKTETYYLELENYSPGGIGFRILEFRTLFHQALPTYFYSGLFFGLVALAFIYNFMLYWSVRESTYLYYCIYVLMMAGFASVDLGYIHLIIYNLPSSNYLYSVPFGIMTISLLLYTRSFFYTKEDKHWIFIAINYVIAIKIISYLLAIIWFPILFNPLIDNICLLFSLATGFSMFRKGIKSSRYFLLGISMLYIGLGFHTFRIFLSFSDGAFIFINKFGLFIFGSLETILFSLALADKFKSLKNENHIAQQLVIKELKEKEELKEKVNKELEEKITERTTALNLANNKLADQSLEIERMNALLKVDNQKLERSYISLSKDRVFQKGVDFSEFNSIFQSDEDCYQFLANLKWETKYQCRKCGNSSYSNHGVIPYSRKCTKCNYGESPTYSTIFQNQKFSILKGFQILFLVFSNKEITQKTLSEMVDLREKTCWSFKHKIIEKMGNYNDKVLAKSGWVAIVFSS